MSSPSTPPGGVDGQFTKGIISIFILVGSRTSSSELIGVQPTCSKGSALTFSQPYSLYFFKRKSLDLLQLSVPASLVPNSHRATSFSHETLDVRISPTMSFSIFLNSLLIIIRSQFTFTIFILSDRAINVTLLKQEFFLYLFHTLQVLFRL